MKLKFSYIALFAAFIFTSVSYAQVDRTASPRQYNQPKNNKSTYDFVENNVTYLTKQLKLDDFQAAAIRGIFQREKDGLMQITQNEDLRDVEKMDKAKVITDRITENIMKLLSPEQAEKYTTILEKNKKKS